MIKWGKGGGGVLNRQETKVGTMLPTTMMKTMFLMGTSTTKINSSGMVMET